MKVNECATNSTYLYLQCFDTIEQAIEAFSHMEPSLTDDLVLFVHEGTYTDEYIVVDINVQIIGAGRLSFFYFFRNIRYPLPLVNIF